MVLRLGWGHKPVLSYRLLHKGLAGLADIGMLLRRAVLYGRFDLGDIVDSFKACQYLSPTIKARQRSLSEIWGPNGDLRDSTIHWLNRPVAETALQRESVQQGRVMVSNEDGQIDVFVSGPFHSGEDRVQEMGILWLRTGLLTGPTGGRQLETELDFFVIKWSTASGTLVVMGFVNNLQYFEPSECGAGCDCWVLLEKVLILCKFVGSELFLILPAISDVDLSRPGYLEWSSAVRSARVWPAVCVWRGEAGTGAEAGQTATCCNSA
ncbi:hypothetical protein EYF80_002265 [Liparis tanakae]|uniref:Uncharacterized protein n=1 Tax=Liparis tanakae TaxID=230148 RepID=A0A4Z2JD22_9TELE|nr:hypothetical protein EYF80_002265 [Liparis tanakae]